MTKTEKEIEDLKRTLDSLAERVDYARREIDLGRKTADRWEGNFDKLRESVSLLQTPVAVLQATFSDFGKRWDESERRRWTVVGVLLAASLSFIANLVLLFLKR